LSSAGSKWKSLVRSYPLGGVEVFERKAVEGDGVVVGTEVGEMTAVVVPADSFSLECGGHDGCPLFRFGA
jgi:hypothetical protein